MTDHKQYVEFHPTWPEDFHFFVDEIHWPKVQDLFKRLKAADPLLKHVAYGHPFVNRPGVRFGYVDAQSESLLAGRLGLSPHDEDPAPPDFDEPLTVDLQTRSVGRPPGPVNRGLVPIATLRKVGQTIAVTGKFSEQSLRLKVRDHCRATGMAISCHKIQGGILLVVTDCRPLLYETVVEL